MQEFKATLRMAPEVYVGLLNKLKPVITKAHTNLRPPISAEERLCLCLRYLALGDGFRTLSHLFRVGLSTSREIVYDTCAAIIRVLGPTYLKVRNTEDAWLEVADNYRKRWNFANCLGAVDGKHIRINAPRKSGSFYYNYKHYHSVVLMAVVSADYKFIYVNVGCEGRASDGGIWSKCSFFKHLNAPNNPLNIPDASALPGVDVLCPYVLIGDSAFKLHGNMMKPFPGRPLTRKQRIFNYRLSRARNTVENVFGIMSCRFRILRTCLEISPEHVELVVMAVCILHNYLREEASPQYMPAEAVDHDIGNGTIAPGRWREEGELPSLQPTLQRNPSQFAKYVRNIFTDYFVSRPGQVSWQYNR